MENVILIETNKKNEYLYSSKNKSFYFIPPGMKRKMSVDDESEDDFYNRKIELWGKNGVFDKERPEFQTYIDPVRIKRSVANVKQVVIEVTDDCNLACSYCVYGKYYNNYDQRIGKKQSFENVRLLMDYLISVWSSNLNTSYENTVFVGFYGGEPLLNFELIKKIINYIECADLKHVSFVYNMTTNAMLLHRYLDYIVEKKIHLLISLDGDKINNANRVMKNGKNSFYKVFDNIKNIQSKYQAYFDAYVNFNAVLNNCNSEEEILSFFRINFNKSVRISELTTNGLSENKTDDFYNKMFRHRQSFFDKSKAELNKNYNSLVKSPFLVRLASNMNLYSGNSFSSYFDLFEDHVDKLYIPTGSCLPFERKIFLTVNGKLLPCERIGQNVCLAKIENGTLNIDYSDVASIYKKAYDKVVSKCRDCAVWESCGICTFFGENNETQGCQGFISWQDANKYFSTLLSFIEENRNLCEKMIKNITAI